MTPVDTSESGGNGFSATITDVGPILEDVHLGDSISINGTVIRAVSMLIFQEHV